MKRKTSLEQAVSVTVTQAEKAAEKLLARVWNFGSSDVPLPVDPVYIAQQLGIEVYEATLSDDTAGMLVKKAGIGPRVYINRQDHPNRQRFTLAHECGHYIKRSEASDDESWEFVDRRDHLSSRGVHADEIFANRFAAALLMPAASVTELARSLDAPELVVEFEVSLEAMKHRLANLRKRS